MNEHKKRKRKYRDPGKKKQLSTLVPAELLDGLNRVYKQLGFASLRECVQDALENTLDGRYRAKTPTKFEEQRIVCRSTCFSKNCKREGHWIEREEIAWFHPEFGFMCDDCYTLRHGGKNLAEKKRKELRLKEILRVLEQQIKTCHESLNLYEMGQKIAETDRLRNEVLTLIDRFMRQHVGTDKDEEAIEAMLKLEENLRQFCRKEEAWLAERILKEVLKKKKAKKKATQFA